MITASMNYKSALFCLGLIASLNSVKSQNNPGYLGFTKSIDLTYTPLFMNAVAGGPTIKSNFGLGYEVSGKKNISFCFGLTHYANTVNQENLDYFDHALLIPNNNSSPWWGNTYDYHTGRGSFDYRYSALTVGTKFFRVSKGSSAPYGSFLGFNLTYGLSRITEDRVKFLNYSSSPAKEVSLINEPYRNISILALQIHFGRRRYIGRTGISYFYQMGMGYPFWQSSMDNLSSDDDEFENHQDLLESAMVRHIANSTLFEFKIGIGYGLR